MNNPTALVQKLWNYCNLLRDDGLFYGDYVEQLTDLLFLQNRGRQIGVGAKFLILLKNPLFLTTRCGAGKSRKILYVKDCPRIDLFVWRGILNGVFAMPLSTCRGFSAESVFTQLEPEQAGNTGESLFRTPTRALLDICIPKSHVEARS